MIKLQDIDLNLLIIFQQQLQERKVSEVAKTLSRSQPAVSNALRRLRQIFDDPLFIRTSEGMQPTPFARRMAEPITIALSNIAAAVNCLEQFDPQTSKRHFVISATEMGEIEVITPLESKCCSIAPGIQISTLREGSIDLVREMEAGRVDLALGAFDNISTSLHRRRIFRQSYVTIFRAGHPLGRGEATLEKFLSSRHILVTNVSNSYNRVNRCLLRAGIKANVKLQVPNFAAVPYLVRGTDCIATVPSRLAQIVAAPFGLDSISPPLHLPSLDVCILWHPRFNYDEGNKWLRDLILALFS
jgi:DNA-binding transcriptional LysR family regulator